MAKLQEIITYPWSIELHHLSYLLHYILSTKLCCRKVVNKIAISIKSQGGGIFDSDINSRCGLFNALNELPIQASHKK
jgi:hypothetical protein